MFGDVQYSSRVTVSWRVTCHTCKRLWWICQSLMAHSPRMCLPQLAWKGTIPFISHKETLEGTYTACRQEDAWSFSWSGQASMTSKLYIWRWFIPFLYVVILPPHWLFADVQCLLRNSTWLGGRVTELEAQRLEETRDERVAFRKQLRDEIERQAREKHIDIKLPPDK